GQGGSGVVVDTEKRHLVAPGSERVGDLVLHVRLSLGRVGQIEGGLAIVIGGLVALVRGVEDDGDPHRYELNPTAGAIRTSGPTGPGSGGCGGFGRRGRSGGRPATATD